MISCSFGQAIKRAQDALEYRSVLVHPHRWQSQDVSKKPEAATWEVLNYSLTANIGTEDLDHLRAAICPNLPWADNHFSERISGTFNPGETWKQWPYALSADKFRTAGNGQFSHTYGERYWPKHAWKEQQSARVLAHGIRYDYGDLMDIINHLVRDPLSRQAYLPIFFPEDTGKLDVRIPCTLGHHFIRRHGHLHHTYYIRSCDFLRHFRDDIYLSTRLHLWVLSMLRASDPEWDHVKPGIFTMHIVSLHLFRNDFRAVFGYEKPIQP